MMIKNWDEFLLPYEQAVEELKTKFKSIRKEFRVMNEYSPIEFVTGRVKKISSIIEKARRKSVEPECVEDIAGIRIICQLVDDIPIVVEHIRSRHGKDMEIVVERDYITNKKESGYRSYHIIISYMVHTAFGDRKILAEIQIRTLAMNFWATIEHSINYKFGENMPEDLRKRLRDSGETASKLDEEMSKIKFEIVDSQEFFMTRSALVARVIKQIQTLFFSGNVEKDEIAQLQEEFYLMREQGSIQDLERLNKKLELMIQNLYLD
ncbi:MAG TPA: GTP pyrophosphokinase [Clostridiales bacterium]|jgi:putative GTP pyrophosphokinase|nr:GTP pyrophosphokinase [Clostridiales bacterium]